MTQVKFNVTDLYEGLKSIQIGKVKDARDTLYFTINKSSWNKLTLYHSDYNNIVDISIESIPGLDSDSNIKFCCGYFELLDIMTEIKQLTKTLESDNGIFEINSDIIKIKYDFMEYKIESRSFLDLTGEPTFDIDSSKKLGGVTLKLNTANDRKQFINNLEQLLKIVPTKDNQMPTLNNVKLEVNRNDIKLIAIDGFRLNVIEYPLDNDSEFTALLSKDLTGILIKILKDNLKTVSGVTFDSYKLDEKQILNIRVNRTSGDSPVISAETLQETFFDYTKIIDNEIKVKTQVDKVKLETIIKSVTKHDTSDNQNKLGIWTFEDGNLQISNADNTVSAKFDHNNKKDILRAGYNSGYVLDSLKYYQGKEVNISLKDSVAPMYIKDQQELYNSDYVILPIRLTD